MLGLLPATGVSLFLSIECNDIHKQSIHLGFLLATVSATALTPLISHAGTVGHWRFEDSLNLGTDSGSNGLDMTNNNTVDSVASVFPATIPNTGASNTAAGDFGSSGTSYLSIADSAEFAFQDFTIESYVQLNSASGGTTPSIIAGQFDTGDGAWQLGITGSGSGFGAQRLYLQISLAGSTTHTQYLTAGDDEDLLLDLDTNYYVAASVDYSVSGVTATFYIQNLTAMTEVVTISDSDTYTALNNSSANFSIGASYSSGAADRNFDGIIDEVRLSDVALARGELLVIPEPQAFGLIGGMAVLFAATRRRRVRA
jgi:hypothetical protein